LGRPSLFEELALKKNVPQDIPPPETAPGEAPRPAAHNTAAAVRKKKARRRLAIIAAAVVVLGGAFWYVERTFSLPLQQIGPFVSSVEISVSGQLQQNFPTPLQQSTKAAPKKANALDAAGVVAETNSQREQNGDLPPLTEEAVLDDIATLRISDMFAQQYFAHIGPQGESAVSVASSVGYSYIALGENLALGNYAGDAGVVAAWMASPGHRANILDSHYTEIGVAVREGMYNGAETWIAVQIFGRPSSACPSPDVNLETTINLSENQINAMATQLQADKAAIDAIDPPSGPEYNAQVQDYNNLAAQYNNLATETKTAIATYNAQVAAFNTCLGAGTP